MALWEQAPIVKPAPQSNRPAQQPLWMSAPIVSTQNESPNTANQGIANPSPQPNQNTVNAQQNLGPGSPQLNSLSTPQQQPPSEAQKDMLDLPEFNTFDGNKALFGGQFGDENTGVGQMFRDGMAGLLTFSGKARVDGIEKRFPELKVERFDEGRNAVVTNPETGGQVVVNAGGISNQDIAPFIGSLVPGGLAGKAVVKAATPIGKVAAAAIGGGATDLALQGAEIAQGSDQGFDTTRLAAATALSGGFQGVAGQIAKKLNNAAARKIITDTAPSIEELKRTSSQAYKAIDDMGVSLTQPAYKRLVENVTEIVEDIGFDPGIHPQSAIVLKRIMEGADTTNSIGKIDTYRKLARQVSGNINNPSDAMLSGKIIGEIDRFIENMPQKALTGGNVTSKQVSDQFKIARSNWSRAKKGEKIQQAIDVGTEAASGAENGIRNELRALHKQIIKGKEKGFSKDEIAAIKAVGSGKINNANLLRLFGKFSFGGDGSANVLGGSLGAAAGGAVAGLPGIAAQQLVSRGAKKLAADATLKNAEFAAALARSPKNTQSVARLYVQQVPKALQSPEELAEIIVQSGAQSGKIPIPKNASRQTKELIRNTMRILAAEEIAN